MPSAESQTGQPADVITTITSLRRLSDTLTRRRATSRKTQTATSNPAYAVQYGQLCQKLFAPTELSTTSVTFDYEMLLSTSQPVPAGYTTLSYWRPTLEWGTLWTVADQLGLHGCEFRDNTTLQAEIRPSLIVALSSLQTDVLDNSTGMYSILASSYRRL
jgi:hypothetical protein